MRSRVLAAVNELKALKKKERFQVIDSHVHPFDVMGVIPASDQMTRVKIIGKCSSYEPSLSERLQFGKLANFLSYPYCKLFARDVNKMISRAFDGISVGRLVHEMKCAAIISPN